MDFLQIRINQSVNDFHTKVILTCKNSPQNIDMTAERTEK